MAWNWNLVFDSYIFSPLKKAGICKQSVEKAISQISEGVISVDEEPNKIITSDSYI